MLRHGVNYGSVLSYSVFIDICGGFAAVKMSYTSFSSVHAMCLLSTKLSVSQLIIFHNFTGGLSTIPALNEPVVYIF